MTSGIGLPYINIAVAESAVRVRSFDVTLCNLFASKDLRKLQLQVRANANIVRLANGLASLQERLAFTMPIKTGRVEASSCSQKALINLLRIVLLKERLALVERFGQAYQHFLSHGRVNLYVEVGI